MLLADSCLVITLVAQTIFSVLDLKFRQIKRRFILLAYTPAIVGGLLEFGVSFEFFLGFFYLATIFYVIALLKGKIGAVDIIAAPIYTVWFGLGFIPFTLIFTVLLAISSTKRVSKFLDSFCKDSNMLVEGEIRIPWLPLLQLTCLIVLVLKLVFLP